MQPPGVSNAVLANADSQLWSSMIRSGPRVQLRTASANPRIRRRVPEGLRSCGGSRTRSREADTEPLWMHKASAPPNINMLSRYVPREWNHLRLCHGNGGLQLGGFRRVDRSCFADSLGFDGSFWRPWDTGFRTWSHRRCHVMASVLPGCALTSLLSSSTLKVTIWHLLSGRLAECWCTGPRMATSSRVHHSDTYTHLLAYTEVPQSKFAQDVRQEQIRSSCLQTSTDLLIRLSSSPKHAAAFIFRALSSSEGQVAEAWRRTFEFVCSVIIISSTMLFATVA